jgi:hypothetical protein
MKSIAVLFAVAAAWASNISHVARASDTQRPIVRPVVVLTGTGSCVVERRFLRVASESDWIKLWQRHKGANESKDYDLFYNPLDLPYIDFEKYEVIAIFQGRGWNNAGLMAVAIMESKDALVVRFENKEYQTAGPGGGGKQTTVYGFFVLPRSAKTIVLEEGSRSMRLQSPVWEERVRLKR